MVRVSNFDRFSLPAVAVWVAFLTGTASGAETLRWKLKEGDTLKYRLQQSTDTETAGTGKAMRIAVNSELTVVWKVLAVDEQHTAMMTQTVDSFRVSLQADKQDPVVYDSTSKSSPSGLARELAAGVSGILNKPVQIRMSARGEVTLADKAAQAADAGSTDQPATDSQPESNLAAVLQQAAVVLPEMPVEPGAQWESKVVVTSPVGELNQTRQITYAGQADFEGASRDKLEIRATATDLKPAASAATKIREGSQTGTLWFDSAAGRLVGGELVQKLVTERPYREMTIRVQSTSTLKLRLEP